MTLSLGFNKNMTSKEATEKFIKAFCDHKFRRAAKLLETGLIDPNFDIDIAHPKKSRSHMNLSGAVLMLTVELGEYDLAKALIKAGANVDSGHISNYGTPLQRATWHGDARMMKLLLEAGASNGIQSSLQSATQYGYKDIKELITTTLQERAAAKAAKVSVRPVNPSPK